MNGVHGNCAVSRVSKSQRSTSVRLNWPLFCIAFVYGRHLPILVQRNRMFCRIGTSTSELTWATSTIARFFPFFAPRSAIRVRAQLVVASAVFHREDGMRVARNRGIC